MTATTTATATATAPRIRFCDLGRLHETQAAEIEASVLRVLRSGALVLGEEVRAFEREAESSCNVRHAIGVASGTDALFLALVAIGVGRGDEVLLPASTYFAALEAIHWTGALPRPIDVGEDHDVCPGVLEAAIGPRTRAFVATSLHGRAARTDEIERLCRDRSVHLLEDACQAFGATSDGRFAGTRGVAGAFSFYPTKVLGAAGDGGMVVTNDDGVAARVRSLRAHGTAAGEKYRHAHVGTNSRLDEVQAAILRVRLRRFDVDVARRRRIAARLDARLEAHAAWLRRPPRDDGQTYYAYAVRSGERDALRAHLAERSIEAPIHFPLPIHEQPAFVARYGRVPSLPGAEALCRTSLSLPCHPMLTDDEVDELGGAIDAFARQR